MCKFVILPVVFYVLETWSLALSEKQSEYSRIGAQENVWT
jgi:hypothetical protein